MGLLWGKATGHRRIPSQRTSNGQSVSISWRHHLVRDGHGYLNHCNTPITSEQPNLCGCSCQFLTISHRMLPIKICPRLCILSFCLRICQQISWLMWTFANIFDIVSRHWTMVSSSFEGHEYSLLVPNPKQTWKHSSFRFLVAIAFITSISLRRSLLFLS